MSSVVEATSGEEEYQVAVEFDFDEWISKNGLLDIKHIFIKHNMMNINTLSFLSKSFKKFVSDAELLMSYSHLIAVAVSAMQNLANSIQHNLETSINEQHQPLKEKKDDEDMSINELKQEIIDKNNEIRSLQQRVKEESERINILNNKLNERDQEMIKNMELLRNALTAKLKQHTTINSIENVCECIKSLHVATDESVTFKDRNILLVYGYIRDNEIKYDLIPSEIKNICIQYLGYFDILWLMDDLDAPKVFELGRAAEAAERHEDVIKCMKRIIELKSNKGDVLEENERNLFYDAGKNIAGPKRTSYRTLSGGFEDDVVDETLLNKYTSLVEDELQSSCEEILELLTKYLLQNVKGNDDETEILYLKMCGDYFRFIAEFRKEECYKQNAKKYYEKAWCIAEASLKSTDPMRLGLALNFSVCYYEILKQPEKACNLAKKAFDSAIEELDTLNDSNYKDSTLIMQLLRDNLTLWTLE